MLINAGVHLPVAQQAAILHSTVGWLGAQPGRAPRAGSGQPRVGALPADDAHPRVAADGGYDPRVQDGFSRCLGRVSAGGSAAQGFLATSRYLSNDEEIIRGAGLPMLSATPLSPSAPRIGRRKADNTTVGDCTHWCSPGPLEAYTLPMFRPTSPDSSRAAARSAVRGHGGDRHVARD